MQFVHDDDVQRSTAKGRGALDDRLQLRVRDARGGRMRKGRARFNLAHDARPTRRRMISKCEDVLQLIDLVKAIRFYIRFYTLEVISIPS